jgi:hypothetical protein
MALIHNLVARFRADTGAFDRNVKKSRTHMTRFGKDVQRMGRQLLAVAGIGGGLYLFQKALRGITAAAMVQERAENDLRAAVGKSIQVYKDYAAELQKQTIYGDEVILSQMAYARNLGVTADKLNDAARAAIGLAAKFRLDLATSMMLVGRASQGQTQMLTRYGIVLDENLSSSEKFNALLKIGADNMKLAEAQAKDTAGTFEQFKNAVGDTAEEIGGPFLDDMTKAMRMMIDFKNRWSEIKTGISEEEFLKNFKPIDRSIFSPEFQQELAERDEWEAFIEKQRKRNESIKKQIEEQTAARKKANEIAEKYLTRVQQEVQLTGYVGEARQHAAQMIKLETDLKKAGLEKTIAGIEAMKEMRGEIEKLSKAQKLARIAEDIGDSFASAFEDMIFEAKKFGDVMKSLFRDISRSVVRNMITTPLANETSLR